MVSVRMLTFDHARERRFFAYLNSGTRASSSELSPILPPNERNLVSKKQKGHRQKADGLVFHGAPDTIRTYDTRFRRAVLYPLSY